MADVVTALARRNPLLPVATLHTQRTALVLFDADDRQVAELVDDVVSIMDGDVVAGRFRELQIRSLGADAGALDPVIDLLLAHGAMPGTSSNAGSALGPAAKAAPDVAEPSPVGPDDPAGDAVHAHLLTHVRRFLRAGHAGPARPARLRAPDARGSPAAAQRPAGVLPARRPGLVAPPARRARLGRLGARA